MQRHARGKLAKPPTSVSPATGTASDAARAGVLSSFCRPAAAAAVGVLLPPPLVLPVLARRGSRTLFASEVFFAPELFVSAEVLLVLKPLESLDGSLRRGLFLALPGSAAGAEMLSAGSTTAC